MQYISSDLSLTDFQAVVLRDDGTVGYEIDGERKETPLIPFGGKRIATSGDGIWCLANSGTLLHWQLSANAWQPCRGIRKPTSLNSLGDGRVCVGTKGGLALVKVEGEWKHDADAAEWLGISKKPRRFRFGVRTLMFLAFSVAIALGPIRSVRLAKHRHRALELFSERSDSGYYNSYTYVHQQKGAESKLPWYSKIFGEELFYELDSVAIHEIVEDLTEDWAKDVSTAKQLEFNWGDSLAGIGQFTKLRSLRLSYIEDVSALKDVPWITELEMSDCGGSISMLGDLRDLRSLHYEGMVETTEPLADLVNLECLHLVDLDAPSWRLDPTKLQRLTKLKELSITRLSNLKSLDWVAGMTELRILRLGGVAKIEDLSPLYHLKHLEELYLPDGTTFDMQLLDKLPKLEFSNCGCTHDSAWDAYITVEHLGFESFLYYNELCLRNVNAEQVPITTKQMAEMKKVQLVNTRIADISMLRHAKSLKYLDLSYSPVRDISVVKHLPNLETVRLEGCPVVDISALRGLANLEYVDLRKTLVKDVSPLGGLSSLRTLDVSFTEVTDFTPLEETSASP